MRQCKIYSCRRYPDRRCCADCDDKTCLERCENHPDRCRCWRNDSWPREVRTRVTKEEEAEIRRLLLETNLSHSEIAKMTGRSKSRVCRVAQDYGIHRETGARRTLDWDEIARLRDEGLTCAGIAERLGCAANSVKYVLDRMGGEGRGRN